MSTRAIYSFLRSDSYFREDVYCQFDNYPEGAAQRIADAITTARRSAQKDMVWAFCVARPSDAHRQVQHVDMNKSGCDYHYLWYMDTAVITVMKSDCEGNWAMIGTHGLSEFLQNENATA